MKPNTIITIVIIFLVIVGFVFLGYFSKGNTVASVQNSAGQNSIKSSLVAPETLYDFGTISMRNGNVTKEFKITNPTDKDIMLSTVITSCMCTSAYIVEADGSLKGSFGMPGHGAVPPANELIKSGDSRMIRVVYDPNAHGPAGVGQIDRFITLTDGAGGSLQLEIKALVTP